MDKKEIIAITLRELSTTLFEHPMLSLEEIIRFGLNSFGIRGKPGNGILSELHCHSNLICNDKNALNDGMPIEVIVNYCFNNNIRILSVTDHRNFAAFDYVCNKGIKEYDIDKKDDKRHLILYRNDGRELIMLRAAEFWTDEGEVNVHGISEKYPQTRLSLNDIEKISDYNGSFWIINRPGHFQGLRGKDILEAIKLGADAIEMDSFQTFPLLYSVVIARDYSNFIPVIAGSDAHYEHQLGKGLVEFDRIRWENIKANPIKTIKKLIGKREYGNIFSYCSPKDILRMVKEHPPVEPEYD